MKKSAYYPHEKHQSSTNACFAASELSFVALDHCLPDWKSNVNSTVYVVVFALSLAIDDKA